MTIDEMVTNLVNGWPTEMTRETAAATVAALLDTNGGISPEDVGDLTVTETDLGGIDIQLHIYSDKMPLYLDVK